MTQKKRYFRLSLPQWIEKMEARYPHLYDRVDRIDTYLKEKCANCSRPLAQHTEDGHCLFAPTRFEFWGTLLELSNEEQLRVANYVHRYKKQLDAEMKEYA